MHPPLINDMIQKIYNTQIYRLAGTKGVLGS